MDHLDYRYGNQKNENSTDILMGGLEMIDDVSAPYGGFRRYSDDYTFYHAATCPDCSGSMIRQGGCCYCPQCGFESCGI